MSEASHFWLNPRWSKDTNRSEDRSESAKKITEHPPALNMLGLGIFTIDGLAPHSGNYKPLIINVALTGAVPKKSRYKNLPTTPQEISQEVEQCFNLGARVFHIHMRDKDDKPTQNQDLFKQAIDLIREKTPKAVVYATTSSRAGNGLHDRLLPLKLSGSSKPDFASLSLGSFNFSETVSNNPPEEILELLETMNLAGIRPELEVFEPGMVHYAKLLISKGLLKCTPVFNILLGNPGSSPADLTSAASFLGALPANSEWAFAGIGRHHMQMMSLAILSGGNVRLGMEDAPTVNGDEYWSNSKAVQKAVEIASIYGRSIETPENARRRLGLE